MAFSSGTRLGSYEIIGALGSGGMGEVYRARDTRLSRDVAIKILPTDVASNQDRLRRFEQEAQSASSLNHPHIITIYEIGAQDSVSYIAMEYIDGKTLREILKEGPLSPRKVVHIATQVAEGLTKAHEAGIVHRDLKPENIMITKDNYAKILDFGLAKLFVPARGEVSALQTAARTDAGTILGTTGYMSPEQARGSEIDFRSDQFSLGSILYELLTGRRAFQGKSGVETLAAIIKEDVPPMSINNPEVPAPLRWVVERCLEKNCDDRYASTRDLARDLQSIRDHFSEVSSSTEITAAPIKETRKWKSLWNAVATVLILSFAGAALYYYLNSKKIARNPYSYHRVTYQRGRIHSATFASDGKTIIYSGSFEGKDRELFVTRTEGVDSRSLGILHAEIFSISPAGEMLIGIPSREHTLAQVSLSGGSPRDLDENIFGACWTPDGKEMAVIRKKEEKKFVEFPSGKILYESTQRLDSLRISPGGEYIALIEGYEFGSNGLVRILGRDGKQIAASTRLYPENISWSADGKEVWFSTVADASGAGYELYALPVQGKQRLIERFPSSFTLYDIFKNGNALVLMSTDRGVLIAGSSEMEREYSWLDNSDITDISADGKMLLIHERGEGSESPSGTAFMRSFDGSPGVRLGGFAPFTFSPDGKQVLGLKQETTVVIPTGAGSARSFEFRECKNSGLIDFQADGKRFLQACLQKDGFWKVYSQKIEGGNPTPIALDKLRFVRGRTKPLSPDGKLLLAYNADGKLSVYPLDGTAVKPLIGIEPGEVAIQWSADSTSIFVYNREMLPASVYKLNVTTGRRTLFKVMTPPDRAGVLAIQSIRISPDEKSYAFTYASVLGTLYTLDGLLPPQK